MEPFGGTLGDTPILKVVEEMVADPFDPYTSQELAEFTGLSLMEVNDALEKLCMVGLVTQNGDTYTVNVECKRYLALTLLAYAVLDDAWGTDLMVHVMRDYLGLE